jgi:hypothetical protein
MKSKYNTYDEWRKAEPKAYQKACLYGLLDAICEKFGWIRPNDRKPNGYWTKERCIEEARNHEAKVIWRISSGGSYNSAKENGWIDECTAHMKNFIKKPRKPAGYWHDKKNCMEEAKKYDSTYDWYKHSPQSLLAAIKINCFTECTKHMSVREWPFSKTRRSKKKCFIEASQHPCLESWKKFNPMSYGDAYKYGWLNYICEKLWNQNIK